MAATPAEALQLLRRRYEGRGVQVARVGDGWGDPDGGGPGRS